MFTKYFERERFHSSAGKKPAHSFSIHIKFFSISFSFPSCNISIGWNELLKSIPCDNILGRVIRKTWFNVFSSHSTQVSNANGRNLITIPKIVQHNLGGEVVCMLECVYLLGAIRWTLLALRVYHWCKTKPRRMLHCSWVQNMNRIEAINFPLTMHTWCLSYVNNKSF